MRRALWILWPSFLVAAAAEAVFFALFDPMEISLSGEPPALDRVTVYSLAFFLFWGFTAASSALTCFLQGGPGASASGPHRGRAEEPEGAGRRSGG